jgi:coiled-coil and C2 domain-containing protein 2A
MTERSATFGGNRYCLDVDVNTVVFMHHHLFSREHVRAAELTRLYEEYFARTRKNAVEFLTGKVQDMVFDISIGRGVLF